MGDWVGTGDCRPVESVVLRGPTRVIATEIERCRCKRTYKVRDLPANLQGGDLQEGHAGELDVGGRGGFVRGDPVAASPECVLWVQLCPVGSVLLPSPRSKIEDNSRYSEGRDLIQGDALLSETEGCHIARKPSDASASRCWFTKNSHVCQSLHLPS